MNRYLKVGAGLIALVVALTLVGDARAAFVTNGNVISGTLADWITAGEVQQSDKLWTYQSSTILPGTTPISFKTETLGNGTLIHTLAIGDVDSTETGATLLYTLQVTTPNNGGLNNLVLDAATLDTTTVGVGSLTGKIIRSATGQTLLTLTSVNGAADTGTIPGSQTLINVFEAWNIQPNGDVNQTFNTFTETPAVPEPVSVAVWALLLSCVGLVVGLRRRR